MHKAVLDYLKLLCDYDSQKTVPSVSEQCFVVISTSASNNSINVVLWHQEGLLSGVSACIPPMSGMFNSQMR